MTGSDPRALAVEQRDRHRPNGSGPTECAHCYWAFPCPDRLAADAFIAHFDKHAETQQRVAEHLEAIRDAEARYVNTSMGKVNHEHAVAALRALTGKQDEPHA